MKFSINSIQLTILFIFLFLITSCNSTKKIENLEFENKLIPSIQPVSNPLYYNLNDRMDYYNISGLSIATIKNGSIDISKGYGFARKESQIHVDTNTVFHAGSISKSVTALIVMKLRDKGVLSLDADIDEYLKSWKLPENNFTKQVPITLRMLLKHTAGIKTFNSKGYSLGKTLPSLKDVLNGKANEPAVSIDTIPGSVYNYSSRGYAIVQIIIEDITNEKFENVANTMIFDPLKMTNSTFKTIYPTEENTNYSFSYNTQGKPNKGYWNFIPQKSAGGLKTTASDLAKLCIAVSNSLTTQNGFLKMQSAKEMMEGENYGLGFDIKKEENAFRFSHSGRVPGFFAYMVFYPETGDGLVLLTNSDNGGSIFQELLRGFSALNSWNIIHPKEIQTIDISQTQINKYIGNYILKLGDNTYEIQVSQDEKNLCYKMKGDRNTLPLRATSETEFIDIIEGERFEFKGITDKALKVISNSEYEFIRDNN